VVIPGLYYALISIMIKYEIPGFSSEQLPYWDLSASDDEKTISSSSSDDE